SGTHRFFGVNASLIDVIDEGVRQLDAGPRIHAVAAATIRARFAASLFGVGRYADGAEQGRKALAVLRARLGENDPRTLDCKIALAFNLVFLFESHEAERLARQAAEGCERVYGAHHEETLRALQCLWLCNLYLNYQNDCVAILN